MFANLINVGHVRMIESCGCLSFLNEAKHALTTARQFSRQKLQGNIAVELRVFRQVHLTHAALAELRENLITTNLRACFQGHGSQLSAVFLSLSLLSFLGSVGLAKSGNGSFQR